MKNIFFIGGVHGTGKGTICKSISDSIHIDSVSASTLLNWAEVSESLENKKVEDIPDTQDRLLNGINHLSSGSYLIDGHYCLLDSKENITNVPVDVFRSMKPINLALVITDPNVISERLYLRDQREYDVGLISSMQEAEIAHAKTVSKELNIHLTIVEGGMIDGYLEILTNLIKK